MTLEDDLHLPPVNEEATRAMWTMREAQTYREVQTQFATKILSQILPLALQRPMTRSECGEIYTANTSTSPSGSSAFSRAYIRASEPSNNSPFEPAYHAGRMALITVYAQQVHKSERDAGIDLLRRGIFAEYDRLHAKYFPKLVSSTQSLERVA